MPEDVGVTGLQATASCKRLATPTKATTSLTSFSSTFLLLQTFITFKRNPSPEKVGPAPDITTMPALLEQCQAPIYRLGLPGGQTTLETSDRRTVHFAPDSGELQRPRRFPNRHLDRPRTPMPPPPTISITNVAEVAEDEVVSPVSEGSEPRKRRRWRLVHSLVRGFRGLFARKRKPTASS